jgi:hypothetical protein
VQNSRRLPPYTLLAMMRLWSSEPRPCAGESERRDLREEIHFGLPLTEKMSPVVATLSRSIQRLQDVFTPCANGE